MGGTPRGGLSFAEGLGTSRQARAEALDKLGGPGRLGQLGFPWKTTVRVLGRLAPRWTQDLARGLGTGRPELPRFLQSPALGTVPFPQHKQILEVANVMTNKTALFSVRKGREVALVL